jgi:hypothetical protein
VALPPGAGVVVQQRVDQSEELHGALVLAQVFVALEEEDELAAVLAIHLRREGERWGRGVREREVRERK